MPLMPTFFSSILSEPGVSAEVTTVDQRSAPSLRWALTRASPVAMTRPAAWADKGMAQARAAGRDFFFML